MYCPSAPLPRYQLLQLLEKGRKGSEKTVANKRLDGAEKWGDVYAQINDVPSLKLRTEWWWWHSVSSWRPISNELHSGVAFMLIFGLLDRWEVSRGSQGSAPSPRSGFARLPVPRSDHLLPF